MEVKHGGIVDYIHDENTLHGSEENTTPDKYVDSSDKQSPSSTSLVLPTFSDLVLAFDLFPPQFAVEYSDERAAQITKVVEFQQTLKARKKKVRDLYDKVMSIYSEIGNLLSCIEWNWSFRTQLYSRLIDLQGQNRPEPTWTDAKFTTLKEFKETYTRLAQMIRASGMRAHFKEGHGYDIIIEPHISPVTFGISSGRYYYKTTEFYNKSTQFRDCVEDLLKKIEDLEIDHDEKRDECNVDDEADVDVLEDILMEQIEVSNKLPSKDMEDQIKKLLAGWRYLDEYNSVVNRVMRDIGDTAHALEFIRKGVSINSWIGGMKCSVEDALKLSIDWL